MMDVVALVTARLAEQIPARTVYPYAVPDGPLPDAYLVVYGSAGSEEATRSCDAVSVQTEPVWVHSVSRSDDPLQAARAADWGARQARAALRGFKPDGRWPVRAEVSRSAASDSTTAESVFLAVEQFSFRHTLGGA